MKFNLALKLCLLFASVGTLGILSGASVTIGSADSGNCFPYACGATSGVTAWQQHFVGSAFGVSGPISINSFTVFANPGDAGKNTDSGTWDVYLATAVNPLGSDSTNLASNLGGDQTFYASISFGPTMPASLTIVGFAPFAFDPTSGDLMIHVVSTGVSSFNGYIAFFQADYTATTTQRNWSSSTNGDFNNMDGALVTQFDFNDTPEPASVVLTVSALGVLALLRRRRVQ